MALSILTSVLVLPALMLFLLNAAVTKAYTGDVPGGSNAMGLVIPVFMAIAGSVLFVLAAWISVARGGLDWLGATRGISTIVATGVSLGIGLAASGVLIAWMERMGSWVPPAGLVCGLLGPVLLAALLLVMAWVSPQTVATSPLPKVAGLTLALLALLGFGLGSYGATRHLQRSAENARNTAAADVSRDQKWATSRARTPLEALRADYAEMSTDAPLWVFVASLPDRTEPDCRTFIIERALKVPDFDAALARTLTDDHPRYRHGCADLIRLAPPEALRPDWANSLATAIRSSTEQITKDPAWLKPQSFSNPNPAEHIRAMVEAAERLGKTAQLSNALDALAVAIVACPSGPERDAAMGGLHARHGEKAGN